MRRYASASITSDVLNFLARMEVATEQDRESVLAKKPAVYKLRMLKEMTDKLKHVDFHEAFLRHGLLKVGGLYKCCVLLQNNDASSVLARSQLYKLNPV